MAAEMVAATAAIYVVNGNFPPFPSHLEATDLAQCKSNLDNQTAVQQKVLMMLHRAVNTIHRNK